MARFMDESTVQWINGQKYVVEWRQMSDEWKGEHMDRWLVGWTSVWEDRLMDKWVNRCV